jgi:glycolate dehydrogenase FAD-binding subunit
MATALESVCADIASIVGESHVTSDPQACAAFGSGGAVPRYAVFPSSAEQVALVLKYASDRDLGVVPCRNSTKLPFGNPPWKYDLALSLKEMNNVWHYEPSDLTISVEPGLKFGDFQCFVGRDNLWLPLDPEGGARASIGGILATNSAGPLRHAYGTPRDMTLGMSIATTDGKVIKAGGRVVKNVAGYDISKLLIGSFGTLGVIVQANFKLFPRPAGRLSFVLAANELETVQTLRRRLMGSSLPIIRMVLVNEHAAMEARAEDGIPSEAGGLQLWIEASGSEKVMRRIQHDIEAIGREASVSVRELSEADTAEFWEWTADFRLKTAELHPEALIAKVSLPISGQEKFLASAQQTASSQATRIAWAAQTGVGIIHLAFIGLKDRKDAQQLCQALRMAAEENGGTLVMMSGAKQILPEVDPWGASSEDVAIMKRLKHAWDPKDILSPGRFAGGI